MTAIQSPKTITELSKLIAKNGKRAFLISGPDSVDRVPAGKVAIDVMNVAVMNTVEIAKSRIVVGTGINLGRLVRETSGENGLLRHAASLIANPLVRNRVTLIQAFDPDSPYFDITTPLVSLEAKVRLQSATAKRVVSIREFLEVAGNLKKGEIPVQIEFAPVDSDVRGRILPCLPRQR